MTTVLNLYIIARYNFKLPSIMTREKSQVLLTKQGHLKLKDELKHREGDLRKKLQDTLNQMRSQGDLKE